MRAGLVGRPRAKSLVWMGQVDRSAAGDLRLLFDEAWYLERYPDIRGTDPLHHYVHFGANEGRDPNAFFDGAWYRTLYRDVAQTGIRLVDCPHQLALEVGSIEEHDRGIESEQQQARDTLAVVMPFYRVKTRKALYLP